VIPVSGFEEVSEDALLQLGDEDGIVLEGEELKILDAIVASRSLLRQHYLFGVGVVSVEQKVGTVIDARQWGSNNESAPHALLGPRLHIVQFDVG
jgi:hypothetical protein